MAKKKKPAGKKNAAGEKEKKLQQAKKKTGSAGQVKPRLLTPQEIIDYYREHKQLPPELQRRVGK